MSILERRKARAADLVLAGPIAALAVTGLLTNRAKAAVTSSDLFVFQSGTIASPDNANGGSPLIIDDISTLTANTVNTTWNLSNGVGGALTDNLYSSNNGSNGQLSLSNNGSVVTFGGYAGQSASNAAEVTVAKRDAVTVNSAGTFTEPVSYSESASGQVRSAASTDGTNYVFGDKTGDYISAVGGSNGSAPINTTNLLEVQNYGGTLYALAANNSAQSASFSSVASNGALTNYTFANTNSTTGAFNSATDFVLLKSGNNGATYDTLYVAIANVLEKFNVSGTTATFVSSATLTIPHNAMDGITAVEVGNSTNPIVDLFATTTTNSTTSATVQEIVDTGAYNGAINASTPTTIYSAGTTANKAIDFYGISLAPSISHSAIATFTTSPPGGYTDVGGSGTSNPSGSRDINVVAPAPGVATSTGYLNEIGGGAGATSGYVTIGGSGVSATTPAVIALAVQITAYGGSSRSLSSDSLALTDVVADLSTNALGTTGSSYTVEAFSALSAAQQAALASGESGNGKTFDIAILTTGPVDFTWDFTSESADGISAIAVTDVGVEVPEPTSLGVLGLASAAMLRRRRRVVAS